MAILVTGAAGFIGFHISNKLLNEGYNVIGIDSLNEYYPRELKLKRLAILEAYDKFLFYPADIADRNEIFSIISAHSEIDIIIHLAAQAGVRYSLENPFAYVSSNLVGQVVMLEATKLLPKFSHFIYASSSSVYGGNDKLPFSVTDNTDKPLSLYAATKKADELLTYSYCHLFGIRATGLRFFTVYGPWGRPDMATYSFTKDIYAGKPITVYNNGDMRRDFTYIDDIISGLSAVVKSPNPGIKPNHKVYNLGNNKSENLLDFIKVLEDAIGKKAIINFAPMHGSDVKDTFADISAAKEDFGFTPKTSIHQGLPKFIEWYKEYEDASKA